MKLVTRKVTMTVIDHAATGAKFRAARNRRGLLIGEVATRMGLARYELQELERGGLNWNTSLMEKACAAIQA